MAQPEHGMHINGELWLRCDTRRTPPAFESDPTAEQQFMADAQAAMIAAHAANTDTPMDPQIAAAAASWVWYRFISLRPTQLEALVKIQVDEDRCDASTLSMITGVPVSSINAIKRKAVAAKAKQDEEEAKAAPAPQPALPPAAEAQQQQAQAATQPAVQQEPPLVQQGVVVQDAQVDPAFSTQRNVLPGSITPEEARAEAEAIAAQNAATAAPAATNVVDIAPVTLGVDVVTGG